MSPSIKNATLIEKMIPEIVWDRISQLVRPDFAIGIIEYIVDTSRFQVWNVIGELYNVVPYSECSEDGSDRDARRPRVQEGPFRVLEFPNGARRMSNLTNVPKTVQ